MSEKKTNQQKITNFCITGESANEPIVSKLREKDFFKKEHKEDENYDPNCQDKCINALATDGGKKALKCLSSTIISGSPATCTVVGILQLAEIPTYAACCGIIGGISTICISPIIAAQVWDCINNIRPRLQNQTFEKKDIESAVDFFKTISDPKLKIEKSDLGLCILYDLMIEDDKIKDNMKDFLKNTAQLNKEQIEIATINIFKDADEKIPEYLQKRFKMMEEVQGLRLEEEAKSIEELNTKRREITKTSQLKINSNTNNNVNSFEP